MLTLFCVFLVLSADLVSELGLQSSDQCSPVEKNGTVISTDNSSESVTVAEIAASSFYLQSIPFLDGDLQSVTDGFPREVNKSVCLKCLEMNSSKKKILSGCSVVDDRSYSAGELLVGWQKTDTAFGTITIGFNETNTDGKSYLGSGDLTDNGQNCSMFCFIPISPSGSDPLQLLYFEYSLSSHCRELRKRSTNSSEVFWERTKGIVWKSKITCKHSTIDIWDFKRGLQIYRSMQLENTISVTSFFEDEERFKNLSNDDIYRAALSLKIPDDKNKTGLYSVYTECGTYNVWYLTPLFVSIALVIILRSVSKCIGGQDEEVSSPYNSGSWYYEAVRSQMALRMLTRNQNVEERQERHIGRRCINFNCCRCDNDELVLVGDGENVNVRIDCRDDDMAQIFEDVGAGPSSSVHDFTAMMDEFQRREESIANRRNHSHTVTVTMPAPANFEGNHGGDEIIEVGAPDGGVQGLRSAGTRLPRFFRPSRLPWWE